MTVYVSDTPWEGIFYAWGDAETVGYIYAAGADAQLARVAEFNAWEAYRVTPEQMGNLIALGAVLTDRYGPVE